MSLFVGYVAPILQRELQAKIIKSRLCFGLLVTLLGESVKPLPSWWQFPLTKSFHNEDVIAQGLYEYYDQERVFEDLSYDQIEVEHSPAPREVFHLRDGPIPSRGSIKDAVFPFLFYIGSVGSEFPGTVATDHPAYTRD